MDPITDAATMVKLLAGRGPDAGRVGVAAGYVKAMADCWGDGVCSTIFPVAPKGGIDAVLKDAQSRLVYRDDAMRVLSLTQPAGTKKLDKAATADDAAITPGACMDFEAVLTSSKRDREKDVLEPAGAEIDPAMPLLWMHMPPLPIGKLLKVTGRTKSIIKTKCSIIDTALGNDAAKMVEFGCLRISHGFRPKKYEPLDREEFERCVRDETPYLEGWHIKEFLVVEESLVSVPANDDAVIIMNQRGQLSHPATKRLGDYLLSKKSDAVVVPALPPACGCDGGTKGTQPAPGTTKDGLKGPIPLMMAPVTGSWEDISYQLEKAAKEFLLDSEESDDMPEYYDALLIATFPDKGVVASCGWSPVPRCCWEIDWKMVDGKPTWDGEPREIEITTNIQAAAEKAFAARTKAAAGMVSLGTVGVTLEIDPAPDTKGAKLAQKHRTKVQDAKDLVDKVCGTEGVDKVSKTLLEKSSGLLGEVVADTSSGDEETETKSVAALGRKAIAAAAFGDAAAMTELKAVAADIKEVLAAHDRQVFDDELDRIVAGLSAGG